MSDDVSYNNVLGKYKLNEMQGSITSLLFLSRSLLQRMFCLLAIPRYLPVLASVLSLLYSQGIVDSEFLADHLPWYRVRH